MRFYFCESCGKRITEHDLDSGQGKDKKLRGFFCADCASGVQTMEMAPLSNKQAASILAKQLPQEPILTSERRLNRPKFVNADPRKMNPVVLWVAGISGVVGLLIMLAWESLSKPREDAKAGAASASHSKEPARPNADASARVQVLKAKSEDSEVPFTTAKAPPGALTVPVFATGAPTPANHSPEPANGKTEHEPESVGKQAPEETAAPPAPPASIDKGAAYLAFDAHMAVLLGALKNGNYAQASECCVRMSNDAQLECLRATVQGIPSLIDLLARRRKLIRAALESLVGKNVSVETRKGLSRGKVVRANDDGIELQTEYLLNGEPREGPLSSVVFSQLTLKEQGRLAPGAVQPGQEGEVAMALQHLANEELPEAQVLLDRNANHPIVKLLSERAARYAWKVFETLAAEAKNETQAKAAIEALDALQRSFSNTEYMRGKEEEAKSFREKLAGLAQFQELALAKLFKGKLTEINAKKQTATVEYDFLVPDQLSDFVYSKKELGGRINPEAGSMRLRYAGEHLRLSQFGGMDTCLRLAYKHEQASRETFLIVWFDTEKKIAFTAHDGGNIQFMSGKAVLKSSRVDLPTEGTWEITAKDNLLSAKLDGKVVLECEAKVADLKPEIGIGGGALDLRLRNLRVTGRINPEWLARTRPFGAPADQK